MGVFFFIIFCFVYKKKMSRYQLAVCNCSAVWECARSPSATHALEAYFTSAGAARSAIACDVHGHVLSALFACQSHDVAIEFAHMLMADMVEKMPASEWRVAVASTCDSVASDGVAVTWLQDVLAKLGEDVQYPETIAGCRTVAGVCCLLGTRAPSQRRALTSTNTDVAWALLKLFARNHFGIMNSASCSSLHNLYARLCGRVYVGAKPMFEELLAIMATSANMNKHGDLFWRVVQTYAPIRTHLHTFMHAKAACYARLQAGRTGGAAMLLRAMASYTNSGGVYADVGCGYLSTVLNASRNDRISIVESRTALQSMMLHASAERLCTPQACVYECVVSGAFDMRFLREFFKGCKSHVLGGCHATAPEHRLPLLAYIGSRISPDHPTYTGDLAVVRPGRTPVAGHAYQPHEVFVIVGKNHTEDTRYVGRPGVRPGVFRSEYASADITSNNRTMLNAYCTSLLDPLPDAPITVNASVPFIRCVAEALRRNRRDVMTSVRYTVPANTAYLVWQAMWRGGERRQEAYWRWALQRVRPSDDTDKMNPHLYGLTRYALAVAAVTLSGHAVVAEEELLRADYHQARKTRELLVALYTGRERPPMERLQRKLCKRAMGKHWLTHAVASTPHMRRCFRPEIAVAGTLLRCAERMEKSKTSVLPRELWWLVFSFIVTNA